jgi:hypothetical protein
VSFDPAILGLDFSPADLYYMSAIRCIEKRGRLVAPDRKVGKLPYGGENSGIRG